MSEKPAGDNGVPARGEGTRWNRRRPLVARSPSWHPASRSHRSRPVRRGDRVARARRGRAGAELHRFLHVKSSGYTQALISAVDGVLVVIILVDIMRTGPHPPRGMGLSVSTISRHRHHRRGPGHPRRLDASHLLRRLAARRHADHHAVAVRARHQCGCHPGAGVRALPHAGSERRRRHRPRDRSTGEPLRASRDSSGTRRAGLRVGVR